MNHEANDVFEAVGLSKKVFDDAKPRLSKITFKSIAVEGYKKSHCIEEIIDLTTELPQDQALIACTIFGMMIGAASQKFGGGDSFW